uniref:Non-specific serine/threonine protein kinase n=1 Tax=Globodera rostochiensis TaxID=31243 RepID=A0A914HB93_GLORO
MGKGRITPPSSAAAPSKQYRPLDAADLNQLQNVYPEIVSELCEIFSHLKHSEVAWRRAKLDEKRIMVMLCSVKQLIKVRNSIFLFHGLQPSLFALFFELLPFADRWVLTVLPNCHYLLLQMAKEFAQTHDHFFVNCEIFQSGFADKQQTPHHIGGPTLSTSNLGNISSVSGKHFAKILGSLAELFQSFHLLTSRSQIALIDWLTKISILVVEKFKSVSELREMFNLRSSLLLGPFFALYSIKSLEVRKNLVKCMYRIKVFNLLLSDESACKTLLHQFLSKLCQCAEELELEQFRTLWNRIPITFLIGIFGLFSTSSIVKKYSLVDNKRDEITTESQFNLSKMNMEPIEFQMVSDFLFERKCISVLQESSMPQNWLFVAGKSIYESLSRGLNGEDEPKASPTFDENLARQNLRIGGDLSLLQKWLFVVSQFAYYCVVNRMKTPIGKTPLETFTKFESELRALVTSSASQKLVPCIKNVSPNEREPILNAHEEGNRSSMNSPDGCLAEKRRNLRPEEEWFRVRMLLHSIDMVEKMMGYAVRGSMFKMCAELPLSARQFFSVNFNTCMDWLSRTALPLMGTAYANGHYAQIVRFGSFLFAELDRKCFAASTLDGLHARLDSSMQLALSWIVRALVRLGAPQAVRGVRMWSEAMFGPLHDFSWCHYAELLASARVEEALDGFLGIIHCAKQSKENVPKVHEHVLNAIDAMALMAAGILRLPQSESRIREAIIDNQESNDGECGQNAKLSGLLSHESWNRVLKLSSWDQMTDPMPNVTPTQSATEFKHEGWELRNRLLDVESKILSVFEIRQKNTNARQNTGESLFSLQDDLSDLAQFLMFGGHDHIDGLEHSKLAILHAICTGIQHLNPTHQLHSSQHQQHFPHKGQQQHAKQQMRSPTKYSASTPILLEVEFADLLHNYQSNALHRLEIGQMYCGWMHRLYGAQKEHNFVLKKMHGQMAQLAQGLGNSQLADMHLRFVVQTGEHHQPLPHGFSNFYIQQQQPQRIGNAHIQSIPPGFEPSFYNHQHYSAEDAHNHLPVINSSISFTTLPAAQLTKSLLSEDFDGDTLRLLPNEMVTMQQFGIDPASEQGRQLEELIGGCSTYDEFRAQITDQFPLTDLSIQSSTVLMALDQPTFTQFWLSIKHRQYRLYELALNSHLRFLENLSYGKSYVQTVEVILRFIKMLTRQPEWFERIVGFSLDDPSVDTDNRSAWMDRIPVDVWNGLIPQLFACLNHPKPVVVNTIRLLLEQIGQSMPHVICYPAIVIVSGADQKTCKMPLLGKPREDENVSMVMKLFAILIRISWFEFSVNTLTACKSLIGSLAVSYPDLVRDTTEFCRSLQRIALLHGEQWLYALTQFDHQITRLLRSSTPLNEHSFNGNAPDHLLQNGRSSPQIDERLREYMEQVFNSIKHLEEFWSFFRGHIQAALDTMEQNMLSDPRKGWEPFKKIIAALNKQALKRSSLCLTVSKISTHLGEMTATSVPVPGQDPCKFDRAVTVHKMDKVAFVLPTKTRPKKLSLTGSDGKTYTFLFKGQENLYMDSRLMQLLRICNAIFDDVKNQRPMDINPAYHCVTYAVTPLGRRSGLIKWVDGAIPLFQIYRKWRLRQLQYLAENEENKQQKMIAAASSAVSNPQVQRGAGKELGGRVPKNVFIERRKNGGGEKEAEPERPMEQFYSKLKSVLVANKVSKDNFNDRKHWPKKLLKKVIKELVEETPKDILAKELWVHAATSDAWWTSTQRFARTAAVSSMLGAFIWLGDRHLDNVLVDLHTGQIVHVDYNICFGKGRTLRVPETVPFRLTENIKSALGPTKCEGIFRQSSERVVEMLRADKQMLLQLMETLKSDPMLDFTFLRSNAELRNKNRHELGDFVVQGISRKLSGFELKRRRNNSNDDNTTSRKSPGLIHLDGESGTKEKAVGEGDWEEVGTANVAEQVDLLIREATDWDNLALMYEGWTAWSVERCVWKIFPMGKKALGGHLNKWTLSCALARLVGRKSLIWYIQRSQHITPESCNGYETNPPSSPHPTINYRYLS